ncbi:hypothetical protein ACFL3T_02235 [Patescibacteria group bacterium]
MPPKPHKRSKISIVRFIYLYLISAITFIVFLIGAVTIVDQGLKSFVFGVEEYDYNRPVPVMIDCERYVSLDDESYENCLKKVELIDEIGEPEKSIFTNEARKRLSIGVAQVLVAFPLWIFHWGIIERDRKKKYPKK